MASSTTASSTTQLMRIEEVEIISMLTPRPASVSNIVAVTPGCDFIPAPMTESRAIELSEDTSAKPSSSRRPSAMATDALRSTRGTVKEMSVVPLAEVFCTIMSTLIDSSARARKRWAAIPGLSGTPATVTLASDVSCVTALTMACSMDSSSSTTHVPGSQVKLERTWSGTWWLRANSTERSMRTRPPVAAISFISSKLMRSSRLAVGTTRGSALKTPVTSV